MPEHPARETSKAAQAFHEYCILEDRSLAKLAKSWLLTNGRPAANLRQLEIWSSAHNWVERVKMHDAEQAAIKQRKQQDAISQMNERHALIGTTQQKRAIDQIERLIKAEKFGSQAAVMLLKLATDIERLARGAPTERSELTGQDGGPLATGGAQVIFYLPKLEHEEGYTG